MAHTQSARGVDGCRGRERGPYGFREEKSGTLETRIFWSRRLVRGARGVLAGEERNEGFRGRAVAADGDDDSWDLCSRFRWRASARWKSQRVKEQSIGGEGGSPFSIVLLPAAELELEASSLLEVGEEPLLLRE